MSEQEMNEEAEEPRDSRPIGGNSEDFEAVLIDGILGFSLSLGNAMLLIIGALWNAVALEWIGPVAALSALVAASLFKIVQLATDAISAHSPRAFYVICHAGSFIVAVLGMGLALPVLSAVAASVGLTVTIILYGRFLAALARNALMLVVDSAFLYAGLMFMVLINISPLYGSVIMSALVLVTIVVAFLFIRRGYDFGELISAADSKSRSIKVKGNVHTVFLVGFMLGAAILLRPLPFPAEITAVALGVSLCVAAVLSLLLRRIDEKGSKNALRKSMSFAAMLLLVPLAVIPNEAKLVFLACFICYVLLNTIVILDAIIETVRFNMIAAMWLLGKECSVFFLGFAIGAALFSFFPWIAPHFAYGNAMLYLCIIAAIFCAWMQIKVNYQVYPFHPVIEDEEDEEVAANIERGEQRKALWNLKIDAVCNQYKLSPREREILPILLRGRDAKYIMDTFYISQSTAKTHIYNIYRKFGIHSRQELLDFVEDIELMDFGSVDEPGENGKAEPAARER